MSQVFLEAETRAPRRERELNMVSPELQNVVVGNQLPQRAGDKQVVLPWILPAQHPATLRKPLRAIPQGP